MAVRDAELIKKFLPRRCFTETPSFGPGVSCFSAPDGTHPAAVNSAQSPPADASAAAHGRVPLGGRSAKDCVRFLNNLRIAVALEDFDSPGSPCEARPQLVCGIGGEVALADLGR
jgi:hypothetical protein